ncbi:Hypothetical protein NTJ_10895 [Nesidiocoris tenuis]|uniref:Cytochrome P450 n=1 Tax=Nesidiocoris tenuis TaxID=355587 RepID=A0ABN7B0Z5_9HEMI|nr:Hypothetical protein NTJ_10895 [Nesidiocoris tenuis]
MFLEILVILLAIVLLFMRICRMLNIPSFRTIRMFNKLPGPTHYPFYIGMVADIMRMELKDVLPFVKGHNEKYGDLVANYALGAPILFMNNPDDIEVLLTSTKNIDKGPDYEVLAPWLGDGLVMSTGAKWKQRRKMLTSSFHFKILDGNTECMNRNWKKVAQKLLAADGAPVEPLQIMGRGALDIICEAAMGTILEKDESGEKYVAAVKRVTHGAVKRTMTPYFKNDFIFKMFPSGKQHMEDVKILHNFTEKVIRERKEIFEKKKRGESDEYSEEGKERNAFLDLILDMSETKGLTESDIREEVDTFMFAGHDTTSTALQFVFLHLGENPEVQEKAYQEQLDIFGYSDRDVTKDDLNRMHYLEQVLKESLRLHPAAPQIARQLQEDLTLRDGRVIPATTKVFLNFMILHRNPKYFPDPEKFDPERFTPENSKGRHPYSYVPFSAGPRNCIGQKFAMMEMKIAMSVILRSCKIKAITRLKDLEYEMAIVLYTKPAILIEVEPRNKL